jgi:dipeptidyl aminopeptidase/acylaminoacyl peptidase
VDIQSAAAPAFSRDGTTLFHLRGSSLAQVWALNLADGAARPLTAHDEKVAILRRAPKDDRIVYGIDAGGDERQQLWLLDATGSRPLTADPEVIHDFGAWSPDGTRIAYAANDRAPAHFDVLLRDVPPDGGALATPRRVMQGTHMLSVSGWTAVGDRLVAIADRGFGDQTLWVIPLEAGAEAHSVPTPAMTRWQSVRWSSDGASLLGLTDHGGRDHLALCRIEPETGLVTWLFVAADRDVEAWSLSPDGLLLATVENDRGYAILRVGELAGDRPAVAGLPQGVVSDLAWAPDSGRLAFVAAAPTEPAGLFIWDAATGAAQPVWRPDPRAEAGLDPARFVPFTLVAWPSFDDRLIPGWLALPQGTPPAAGWPAVVWVHGGPASQTRANFRPDMQMLLAAGYAVLMPNVRGSTGYGRAYTESDDREKRLDSVADLAHARHWLAVQPGVDADRIAVMGQSYGGYMVLAAITEYPELWRAAIDYYGIADFATLLAATGPWRRSHRAAEYGEPERDAALFERISPIHSVERVRAPLLVLHGTRDPRVPIGESTQFVTALQERQKPVREVVFDYAGHGFIRPDDRRTAYRSVVDFLAKHL